MKVKILDVTTENVVKGKARYSKATVAYMYNGEAKTQSIMSFANPSVFKDVTNYIGQEVEVSVKKNDTGYNEWAAIGPVCSIPSDDQSTLSGTPSSGVVRVTGSNYETREERAQKQVYIIKQSSITAALTTLQAQKTEFQVQDVTDLAQQYTDWVLGKSPE